MNIEGDEPHVYLLEISDGQSQREIKETECVYFSS